MGISNSETIRNKGNSVQILPSNSYRKHLSEASNRSKKRVIINNMNKKKYEEWLQSLKHLQKYNEYLELPHNYSWKVDCVCSEYGCLEIQYQDCIYTLNDEIAYRSKNQQYFKQYQIWYILFLIITIQYTISNQIKHYSYWNIHPQSIVITEAGFVKLLFTITHPKEQENCSNQFIPPQEIPYLLMQLIKSTDERVVMRINKQISQTFQLGLTLLSAANLKNYQFLYKYSPLLHLNIDKLKQQLYKWAELNSYTVVLTSLITNLCSFNPAQRLSGPELWEWVSDHGQDIKQRSSFNFKYLPKQLSTLVQNKMKNNQQNLLRSSQLKHKKLSNSQIDLRKSDKSPQKSRDYEKNMYQPLHATSPKNLPFIPRYYSSKN